jgi:hypothetical protein
VYVDGALDITINTGLASASGSAYLGPYMIGESDGSYPFTFDIDDLQFMDTAFPGGTLPGEGKVIWLPAISDNNRGTWTGGAGGTTNLYDALNNLPPVGVAAGSDTNTSQIQNAQNASNQDGLFNLRSYADAGITSFDSVMNVMALLVHGEGVTTGTKAGDVWISSNPAQAAGAAAFNYGDDLGAAGAYPGNKWQASYGAVATSPSVALGTSPVLTIRKTTATSRETHVCLAGAYVEYRPGYPVTHPFIGRRYTQLLSQ